MSLFQSHWKAKRKKKLVEKGGRGYCKVCVCVCVSVSEFIELNNGPGGESLGRVRGR